MSTTVSRLTQGRSCQPLAMSSVSLSMWQISGARELLLALGYSVRYVLVTEDELLVSPEREFLPLLTRAQQCFQTLLGK